MSLPKKIFIISSVLLAAVLFFMGIYNVSFKNKDVSPKLAENQTQSNEDKNTVQKVGEKLGLKSKKKIYQLTNEPIVSPALIDDEKIIYYKRGNGSVYEISLDGEKNGLVDDNNFSGLESIKWSPDRNKVISRFNNSGKIQYSTYDYKTEKASKLADGIEYAIWDNLGEGVVYKYSDQKTGKKTINISNSDGSNWKKIADAQMNNTFIALVPQSSFVSFWNSPNSFEETSFSLVSTIGGEARKIFSGRFGADYLWSPNGTKALVSSADSKGGSKMSLGVINSNGGEFQNLNIPTFVSKCVWSSDNKNVYYALPAISEVGLVLPNDYQNKKVSSKDTFWKLDITTGKNERVVEIKDIENSYDASDLFLSPPEDVLFFVNRIDGNLYGINL